MIAINGAALRRELERRHYTVEEAADIICRTKGVLVKAITHNEIAPRTAQALNDKLNLPLPAYGVEQKVSEPKQLTFSQEDTKDILLQTLIDEVRNLREVLPNIIHSSVLIAIDQTKEEANE